MPSFDSYDYNITKRLPEWWKGYGALEPINEETQRIIAQILEELLKTMGVVQPLNCWLTIPEEYTWYHHYKAIDNYLISEGNKTVRKAVTTIFAENKLHALLPNTKRKCHSKILLKFLGTELNDVENEKKKEEKIEKFTIENADQKIIFKNISTVSTIEIITETNEILIDGVLSNDLVEGTIEIIKPVIKYADYIDPYTGENIDLKDENKKTELIFDSSKTVDFDLQVYLKKPTYTTEQNIKIATVSAFPIESINMYGYFCHPFNNKAGYQEAPIFTKTYTRESRTTYDRITTQYDCERFYIKVKFYGIDVPLVKGFPQADGETNQAFQPNPNLDRWGKIYGLPRRVYKPNITEEEEPFTFPKYYPYPLEQDYWYEKRMLNEYSFDDEAVNALFVKDDDFNNIGMLECIYPYMNNIWVYTETIDPSENKIHSIKDIQLCSITQDEESAGVEWSDPQELINNPIYTILNPQTDEAKKEAAYSYMTKKLKCSFCLKQYDEEVPKNVLIKGIELKFKTNTTVQAKTIKLSKESKIIIPYINEKIGEVILEDINIIQDEEIWMKDKGYYTVGGENNLFQQDKITREQLFNGNDGKLDFELVFINENNFLESTLYLEDITLNLYYEAIPNKYDINVSLDKKEIDLLTDKNGIKMKIDVANKGDVSVEDKEIFIVISPELRIASGADSFKFDLKVGESFSIDDIIIKAKQFLNGFRTGKYNILVFCEDKVISNEIIVKGSAEICP